MEKKSRKPKYYSCSCGKRLRLNGVKVPVHESLQTRSLCPVSGSFIPEIKHNAIR